MRRFAGPTLIFPAILMIAAALWAGSSFRVGAQQATPWAVSSETEANKEVARRFFGEFHSGNLAVADDIMAPGAEVHVPGGGFAGPEAQKQALQTVQAAFPDMRWTIEDILAEGDKVAVRWSFQGTHRGEFLGVPATGKQVHWTAIDILRIADGKIAERWSEYDLMTMLQQLGAVPGA